MDYQYLGKLNNDALKQLTYKECALLCREIREEMVATVIKNGGHLASNLGVVELTVALHRVFDSPQDRFIFDVSHQSYVHKLLTDRFSDFQSIRRPGGLSGFQKRSESEHDPFGGGHASTSLSAALGFAEADFIMGSDRHTIAIAGDGAFTGGMIHEAMNNCREGRKLILILNENEMSISPNIGGFATYIANVRSKESYFNIKRGTRRALSAIPVIGRGMVHFVSRQKSRLKNLLYSSNYFEKLGFYYLGPTDGHDLVKLERLLREAKEADRPVIVHIKTKKGHGYQPAESDPGRFHGISAKGSAVPASFSSHFGKLLSEMADEDPKLCAITAAMRDGTGLVPFANSHPTRFFDVGIAEEHAMTFAAGLSAAGMHPVFAVYSTFLQRSYDQLIHDVSLQDLDVTVAVDRAGLAICDGATHHGIYDVSIGFTIPGSSIYAPLNFASLERILPIALQSKGCNFVRYRSGGEFENADVRLPYYNKALFIRSTEDSSPDGIILTYGQIAEEALRAREIALQKGISLRVIALEKLRPEAEILSALTEMCTPSVKKICFLEEGVQNGGCAMAYREALSGSGIPFAALCISNITAALRANESPYRTHGISAEDVLQSFDIL